MASDLALDRTKDWILVWVPGTKGHEVHPGFQAAVDRVLGDRAQTLCVHYPASIDFEESEGEGRAVLDAMLREIAAEKLDFQRVAVAGSSQGSWVIDDALDLQSFDVVHKAVMFGLPAESPPLPRTNKRFFQVINHPYDAVTMPWIGNEQRIIHHASQAVEGKWWHLLPLLGYVLMNPIQTWLLVGLTLTHYRFPRLSPHDYTPEMPLAVKWLTT